MKLSIEVTETELVALVQALLANGTNQSPTAMVDVSELVEPPPPDIPTRRHPKPLRRPAVARSPTAAISTSERVEPPAAPNGVVPTSLASNGHAAPALPPEPTRDRLPFAQLDTLVRSEMKRLSLDGRMPGHKLWESERDPRLPTLGAIISRYKCANLIDLAAHFGLEPPLSVLSRMSPVAVNA